MNITPDEIIVFYKINATILMTWINIVTLGLLGWITSRSKRLETVFDSLLDYMIRQLNEIGLRNPEKYIPLLCSLFLFITWSGVLSIIPGYIPPTGSLSTTVALAITVFIAVPYYSISEKGFWGYLKNYVQPSIFVLPFHILSELTRTIALAVRLFGNMMSGTFAITVIIGIVPFFSRCYLVFSGSLSA